MLKIVELSDGTRDIKCSAGRFIMPAMPRNRFGGRPVVQPEKLDPDLFAPNAVGANLLKWASREESAWSLSFHGDFYKGFLDGLTALRALVAETQGKVAVFKEEYAKGKALEALAPQVKRLFKMMAELQEATDHRARMLEAVKVDALALPEPVDARDAASRTALLGAYMQELSGLGRDKAHEALARLVKDDPAKAKMAFAALDTALAPVLHPAQTESFKKSLREREQPWLVDFEEAHADLSQNSGWRLQEARERIRREVQPLGLTLADFGDVAGGDKAKPGAGASGGSGTAQAA